MLKRVIVICMAVVMVVCMASCGTKPENQGMNGEGASGKSSAELKVDYGKSDVYGKKEMDEAIAEIELEFKSFSGAELTDITYYGDESTAENMVEWSNFYRDEETLNKEGRYMQCIAFKVKFHATEAIPAIDVDENSDNEYEWWLAKTDKGAWETWGYGEDYAKNMIHM